MPKALHDGLHCWNWFRASTATEYRARLKNLKNVHPTQTNHSSRASPAKRSCIGPIADEPPHNRSLARPRRRYLQALRLRRITRQVFVIRLSLYPWQQLMLGLQGKDSNLDNCSKYGKAPYLPTKTISARLATKATSRRLSSSGEAFEMSRISLCGWNSDTRNSAKMSVEDRSLPKL
jgi:hypothetical protein